MYWGTGKEGTLWVSSELKAIVGGSELNDPPQSVKHFPPATFFNSHLGSQEFYSLPSCQSLPRSPYDPTALINAIFAAVRSHMASDVPYAVLLSGGIDSSVIAAVAARIHAEKQKIGGNGQWHTPRLTTFCLGLSNSSTDKKHAQAVADHIGSEHHFLEVTEEELLDALRPTVEHLETFDSAQIRAGMLQYLLAKRIKPFGFKVVLSGEGADEIFAGYWHWKNLKNAAEVHRECVSITKQLYHTECLRANKSMMAHSIELRVPFLDRRLLDLAMAFEPHVKMPGYGQEDRGFPVSEKWTLRRAVAEISPPLLLDEQLWRAKEGFSVGAGGNKLREALDKLFSEHVTDSALSEVSKRWTHCTPKTKEEYYLRGLFEELFGSVAELAVPKFWRQDRLGMGEGEDWKADANSFGLPTVS